MRNYTRRRNPGMDLAGGNTVALVGGGALGFFGSRFIPQNVPMLEQYNTGVVGYALNAGVGLAIAWGLGKFWSRSARTGALVGTGVAVLARIVTEQFSSPAAPAPAASAVNGLGDLGFDLRYYTSDHFPFPQGAAGGPYAQFPGSPYGRTAMVPTAATAVNAGAAAAAAALPAAASAGASGGSGGGRWDSNWG